LSFETTLLSRIGFRFLDLRNSSLSIDELEVILTDLVLDMLNELDAYA